MMEQPIVIDFETHAIQARPDYPPKPVGVAINIPGKKPEYHAWGHPTENNTTKEKARNILKDIYRSGKPLLFHHAKFDLDVAEEHLGLKLPPWHSWHDTMLLLFLGDPHARSLALKPSAERLLGIKSTERDKLKEWILANVPEAKKKPSTWGAYICKAPGGLVGKYAIGDVTRPPKLFKILWKQVIEQHGMQAAYDRERKLLPILLANEREGTPMDPRVLARDLVKYEKALEEADNWLRKKLKTKDLNVDSNDELADAIEKAGYAEGEWGVTPTGKRSTNKASMESVLLDKNLIAALKYRGAVSTSLTTFMRPWLEIVQATNGRMHTNWNQVKQTGDRGGNTGTRTGRLSSSPNFQNVPKVFKDADDVPLQPPKGTNWPDLPKLRSYFIPEKGHVFLHRDYNQQELRILAHFEDGDMCAAYNKNPWLDFHEEAKGNILNLTGVSYLRKEVKITNFGLIYGMGVGKLARSIGTDVERARRLKNAILTTYPGLKDLSRDISFRGRTGEYIKTWGGRCYYVEPAKVIDGETHTYEYKLLNYLIQGSAADCTKESIIRYEELRSNDARFLITVHDENNISAPKKIAEREMGRLREAMESVEFDVPMLSEGKSSEKNWASVKTFNDKRKTK